MSLVYSRNTATVLCQTVGFGHAILVWAESRAWPWAMELTFLLCLTLNQVIFNTGMTFLSRLCFYNRQPLSFCSFFSYLLLNLCYCLHEYKITRPEDSLGSCNNDDDTSINGDNGVYVCRLQEKHVKEKQCEHQKNIIEVQEKLKTNLSEVSVYIPYIRRCCRRLCRLL